MSGELVGFLAAHARRAQELFAAEVQSMDADVRSLTGAPRPDTFIDAVLVALGDDNVAPLVSLFGLGGSEPSVADRLDRAFRHIDALGRAAQKLADEEHLPSKSRIELAILMSEELSVVSHQLSAKVVAELAGRLSGAGASKGPSLSITMHELRRPLTILSSYGQLLATGVLGPLPDSAQVAIEGISASTEMMVRMVNALAEVSRLEDPDDRLILEEIELDELVSASIEQLGMEAQLREIRLRRIVPEHVQLLCDRRRMTLALTNLVSNAIKHGPNASEVTIRASIEAGEAHFVVTDQGAGFPAEDAGHLFEKYFRSVAERQRKVPGSGLGLFIVKTIAERHSGSVSARVAPAGGAEFELVIPLRQDD